MKLFAFITAKAPAPAEPSEIAAAREKTLKLSTTEGSIWSFMSGFGDSFISPFAIFLKASNQAMALLGTMPALLNALAQAIGASAADRLGRRRRLIVPLTAAQAFMYLPLFLVPFFFRGVAVPAVILCAALGVLCGGAATPAWLSLMGEVVPRETRGDYFGRRNRLVVLFVFVANLLAGGTLFLFQRAGRVWVGFGVLFIVACLARLVSARLLALHYDPPYRPPREAYFSFWDFIRRMPRSNFAKFALYFAMMMGACNIAAPFFNVYTLRDLHWSYAQFTLSNAVFLVSQVVLLRWWGRIGDRHGNRVVLAATGLIIPLMPLLWTFSTEYAYILAVQVISGAGWSGFSMAAMNFTYDAVTPHKRARIASYTTILNGLFTLAGGTFIGAYLADHLPSAYNLGPVRITFVSSLPGVFLVSAALRLLATLIMVPLFKEVREVERIHPAVLILRLSGGQALAGFLSAAALRVRDARRRPPSAISH
ncbi:MAG: MFS transporter [Kiritimatiellae bacterium]|nr:MFS transporter [Kiritimatiellia bacterium]